jgi:hypothetical protein
VHVPPVPMKRRSTRAAHPDTVALSLRRQGSVPRCTASPRAPPLRRPMPLGQRQEAPRLRRRSVEITTAPVGLEEVLPPAPHSLSVPADAVALEVPESLPPVLADRGLLERALANVIANAIRYSPPGLPARVTAGVVDAVVDVRVVDRGFGVPRNAGKLVTQRHLLQEVWLPQYEKETNYLRVYLAQIRRKLEPDSTRPRYFITEARMGYRFVAGKPPRRRGAA